MSEGPRKFVRIKGMPAGQTIFVRSVFVRMTNDATKEIIQRLESGCDEEKECSCLRSKSIFAVISLRNPFDTPNTVHTAIAEAFKKMLAKPGDMVGGSSALTHLRDCEATFTKRAKRKREKEAKRIKKKGKATYANTSSDLPTVTLKNKKQRRRKRRVKAVSTKR